MNPGSFFAELKRRNVYRVAITYIVAAWALAQGLAQLLPVFDIPNWTVRLLIVLLILGFPLALIAAWAFEITPEGIKRTQDVDAAEPIRRHTGRKFIAVIICLATLAVAATLIRVPHPNESRQQIASATSGAADIPAKSIAVLPFQNLSSEQENSYFADGIQEEILTRLAKIADLKVISRTSTLRYKSAPENLSDIARQLGVANILEGSVQKSGDEVRVHVQLIKAATDAHLWADRFDRKLTDIFSVEAEIAKAIADQLQAKLTGHEEQIIAAKPTNNPEAYDAYLRGLAYTLKPENSRANSIAAQQYFRQAVKLDPNFALSWALLSYNDSLGYISATLEPTAALREEAQKAADMAVTLQPNLGEALLAKGYYCYACLRNYDTAEHYFEEARHLLPNSSRVPEALALVARRRGRWEQSESYFNEAERLDPRNVSILTSSAHTYIAVRRFDDAVRKLDQVLDIAPDDIDTVAAKAAVAQARGDLPTARALLVSLEPGADHTGAIESQVYQTIMEHNPAQMIARLDEVLRTLDPNLEHLKGDLHFWLGWAQQVHGDTVAARGSWAEAVTELQALADEQPENYGVIGDLALTNMFLGNKAAALALSQKAMSAVALQNDALIGPFALDVFARVAAQIGDRDGAVSALEKLISTPYASRLAENVPLTPALLRLDPMFDPLRGDPRFEKLAASPASDVPKR